MGLWQLIRQQRQLPAVASPGPVSTDTRSQLRERTVAMRLHAGLCSPRQVLNRPVGADERGLQAAVAWFHHRSQG